MSYFRGIYAIERRIRDKPPEVRYEVRQLETKPLLERFHRWVKDTRPKVPPSTPLGKALAYLTHHWDGLIGFLDDGRLEVDNNRAENAIRPFTLGRRAWLFSATVEGAKASANLFSLVETAKANHIETLRLPASPVHRVAQGTVRRGHRSPAALAGRARIPQAVDVHPLHVLRGALTLLVREEARFPSCRRSWELRRLTNG